GHRHPRAAGILGAAEGLLAAARAGVTRATAARLRWRASGPPFSCSPRLRERLQPRASATPMLPEKPAAQAAPTGSAAAYNARVKSLASLALSSLLPLAAQAQVDATGDYLSRMDADGDGRVSLAEYQDWMSYAFD